MINQRISLRFLLFFCLLCLWTSSTLQAQKLDWVITATGNNREEFNNIYADDQGFVYATGTFTDSIDAEPGPGAQWHFVTSGIPIIKYDSAGTLIWARYLNGTSFGYGADIVSDALGNVYVTGSFSGQMDFDPGQGTQIRTSEGRLDFFFLKLDASGNLEWFHTFGGEMEDFGHGLCLDDFGHIWVTGAFLDTIDLDPGPGVLLVPVEGWADEFLARFDTAGQLQIFKAIGTPNGQLVGLGIACDEVGNIYVSSSLNGTVDVDPDSAIFNLSSPLGMDGVLSSYDSIGGFRWAGRIGGSSTDETRSVATGPGGMVVFGGRFWGMADLDPSSGTNMVNGGAGSSYLIRMDTAGNYVWSRHIGGFGLQIQDIAIDASGNIYSTGDFNGSADMDPGSGTYALPGFGLAHEEDAFISVIDSAGNFNAAVQLASDSYQEGWGITIGAGGKLYVGGFFHDEPDFDPGPDSIRIQANWRDAFLMCFEGCQLPQVNAINTVKNEMCQGDTLMLTLGAGQLNGASNWYWYAGGAGMNLVGVGDTLFYSGSQSDTLYVRGEGCFQVSPSLKQPITVFPPFSNLSYQETVDTLCADGGPLTLTPGTPAGGVYSGPGVNGNTFSPVVAGTGVQTIMYSVTDSNGCESRVSDSVTVFGLRPAVPVLPPTDSICQGSGTHLTILSGQLNSASQWEWYSGSCGCTVVGTGNSIPVNPSTTTTYYVRGIGGCALPDSCASIEVLLRPLPQVSYQEIDSVCLTAGRFPLAQGMPVGGTYSGPGVSGNQFSPTIAGLGAHPVYYAYTDAFGCTDSVRQVLTVKLCTGQHDEQKARGVRVQVDPGTRMLRFSNQDPWPAAIRVYDLMGRLRFRFNLDGNTKKLIGPVSGADRLLLVHTSSKIGEQRLRILIP